MKARSLVLAVELAVVSGLAVLSFAAAPPEAEGLFVSVSLVLGAGIVGLPVLASEGVRQFVRRWQFVCFALVVAIVALIAYAMLYRQCVIEATKYSRWKAIPVYFPLILSGEIANDVARLGSRQAVVNEYGPKTINEELAKTQDIAAARNATTFVLIVVFETAFAPVALLSSLVTLLLLEGAENHYLDDVLTTRFRVALSFPGEHRKFVAEVAEYLARELGRNKVFYDKWFEGELARIDLDKYLKKIYRDQSDLVVVFLCGNYERKDWCRLEWSAVRELIDAKKGDRLMLIRIDDGDVSNVVSTDGYLSVDGRSAREISEKIIDRLTPVAGDEGGLGSPERAPRTS